MSDLPITNCHVHLFTTRHTPHHFPHKVVSVFRHMPKLVSGIRWASQFSPWEKHYEFMQRMESFHHTGQRETQKDVFNELRHFYPSNARFVVLPLDMQSIGYGPVDEGIELQHRELAALAKRYPDNLIPFANFHPDTPGAVAEFKRAIEEDGFRGLKLYTKTGFAPTHPLLMNEIYPYCQDRGLPVISHCSRGGVHAKKWRKDQAAQDAVTEPYAYREVLQAFPKLQVCLAHYGGQDDWQKYINEGFDPEKSFAKDLNWVEQINTMIKAEGVYDNLWTDISYTMFHFNEFGPLLKLFLADEKIRSRVLFGSDFYMTRQEKFSEKAVSIRLRDALGEEVFSQIAMKNPTIWLGEADETSNPVDDSALIR